MTPTLTNTKVRERLVVKAAAICGDSPQSRRPRSAELFCTGEPE